MSKDLNNFLDDMINKIMHQQPRADGSNGHYLAQSLLKWKPLIYSSIKRLMKITHRTQEEAFQDLMVPISRINDLYLVKLFRYKGGIYEEVKRDGKLVMLRTARHNLQKSVTILVRAERVEKVKKASMSFLIYNKINQTTSSLLKSFFTQKNGYQVIGTKEIEVTARDKRFKQKTKKMSVNEVEKWVQVVGLDEPIQLHNDKPSTLTHTDVIASDVIDSDTISKGYETYKAVSTNVSSIARSALAHIYEQPTIENAALRSKLKISNKKLKYALREIKLATDRLTGSQRKSPSSPYAIYKDNYYYLENVEGSVAVLRLNNRKKYVNSESVRLETEMSYRTPVHFEAIAV